MLIEWMNYSSISIYSDTIVDWHSDVDKTMTQQLLRIYFCDVQVKVVKSRSPSLYDVSMNISMSPLNYKQWTKLTKH